MKTVSIIVPVYNGQQWLKHCVKSIMHQSEPHWQLILVDDGSTDASPQMCDEYAAADSRISVIHQPNQGLSAARNAGIDIATGDFLFFVDADDVLHHSALAMLLEMYRATEAQICIGGTLYAEKCEFGTLNFTAYKELTSEQAIKRVLYQRHKLINSMCNTLISSKLFKGLRFTVGLYYEDLDIFYKVYARAENIAYTSQITYHYRTNPESFINTWSESRLDVLTVVDNLVQYMAQHGSAALQRAAADRRFSAYYNMFVLAAQNQRQDICNRCWAVIREQRLASLINPHVRLKNKIGALVSYLGKHPTTLFATAGQRDNALRANKKQKVKSKK
jgi:glycosyltransferase involved in cell wall biosynthesis